MLKNFLLVGLGGCLGSMLRYAAWHFIKSENFPAATLLVNILGSFIIGIIIGLSMKDAGFSQSWKVFLTTGICGGFTTFSAFSIENMLMLQNGKYLLSLAYISGSILFGIAAAGAGFKLVNY